MKKVLIFGGTGFIGRSLINQLVKKGGYDIQVVARKAKNLPGVNFIESDALDVYAKPHRWEPIIKDCHSVIYLIGLMHNGKGCQTFQLMHEYVPSALAELAKKTSVPSFIFVSAIGADKNSTIPYAKSKGDGEESVKSIMPSATILKPSLVFGPEDDFFNRFAKIAKWLPFMPVFGGGKSKFQPVFVEDVSQAIVKCIDDPTNTNYRTYELGGPKVYTYRELMEFVLQKHKLSRYIISFPYWVGYIQGWLFEKLPLNLFTITRDQVKLLKKDNVVAPNAYTLSSLGINPTELH